MIHPHTRLQFVSEEIGYGVVATQTIPAGTIVWVRDQLDRVLTPTRVNALPAAYQPHLDRYCYTNSRGSTILCWDHARYINHSCQANCFSPGDELEIAVFDIQPGNELCDDYGTLNIGEPFECLCGAANCRGLIQPDDVFRHGHIWDLHIEAAMKDIDEVDQPLTPFLPDQHIRGSEPLSRRYGFSPSVRRFSTRKAACGTSTG